MPGIADFDVAIRGGFAANERRVVGWRYARQVVEHPLPIGAVSRPAVGDVVGVGSALATGTVLGSPTRVIGARRLGIEPEATARVHSEITASVPVPVYNRAGSA